MDGLARIYVTRGQPLTPGIKTLLTNNRIPYVEIDVTDDVETRTQITQQTGLSEWPVIELEGKFAAGRNVVTLSRALTLELTSVPGPPQGCC